MHATRAQAKLKVAGPARLRADDVISYKPPKLHQMRAARTPARRSRMNRRLTALAAFGLVAIGGAAIAGASFPVRAADGAPASAAPMQSPADVSKMTKEGAAAMMAAAGSGLSDDQRAEV